MGRLGLAVPALRLRRLMCVSSLCYGPPLPSFSELLRRTILHDDPLARCPRLLGDLIVLTEAPISILRILCGVAMFVAFCFAIECRGNAVSLMAQG